MVFISSRRRDRRILRNPPALPRGKIGSPCQGRGLISSAMKIRALLLLLIVVAVAACEAPYKKKDDADKQPFKDQSGDQAFQAFLGRLRRAVANKDHAMLSSMMAPDFGYRWDNPPPGETPFIYWDQHNAWPDLAATLRETFVPHERFMVAPAAVVNDPNYKGYRAGMRSVGGSWKFGYFVPTE